MTKATSRGKNSTKTKTKKYYKNWYDKNKARLAEKRKKRYEEDPEYRDIIAAARERHAAKKRKESPVDVGNGFFNIKIGKEFVKLMPVGNLLKRTGLTYPVLYKLEAAGVIPAYDKRFGNVRHYTDEQVRAFDIILSHMPSYGLLPSVQKPASAYIPLRDEVHQTIFHIWG